MRFNKLAPLVAAATAVIAQRPEDQSICDYYTTALLKENTAENQATLLTLVVNTVVIGNYTQPNVGIKVPGILAKGEVDGVEVNLMPYFDGTLPIANRGGSEGEQINFLDGGGAAPLMENKPANDDTSEQYFLLTHLYQFFGALLGCSQQGMPGFDAYSSEASMFEVHKFMNLNLAENTYFITQVGMAAASFGVAEADVTAVGEALIGLFNARCAPPTEVIPGQGPQLQSICTDEETCPLAKDAKCDAAPPSNGTATATTAGPTATATKTDSTTNPTGTDGTTTVPSAAAAVNGMSIAALAAGVAAFVL